MSDQNEFALYPRFGKLNCLNLLHLQQHLYELERKLEELDIEELSSMESEEAREVTSPDGTAIRISPGKRRQQSESSGMSRNSALSTRSIGFGGLSAQEKTDRQAMGCEDGQCHILTLPAPYDTNQALKKLPLSLRRCKLMGEVSKTLKAYSEWSISCV